ncbi:MAG: aspartate dehydrogenase [Lachnospiraceae bacterium]|nr:aspartate dehydrogenase [Lachnospiraceae bacterium]
MSISDLFKRKSNDKFGHDPKKEKPIIRVSTCTGEQVAGFKNIKTGEFHEVALIKNKKDLESFMKTYGLDHVDKEY